MKYLRNFLYKTLIVGVIVLICCNYIYPVFALGEDPIIVSITISPENPTPLSTINFTAEIKGENISEVYMLVKEADENLCMPTRNVSMDKINEEIYECNITLEYAGATYISYTPVVNCNGTWYEFEWYNKTLHLIEPELTISIKRGLRRSIKIDIENIGTKIAKDIKWNVMVTRRGFFKRTILNFSGNISTLEKGLSENIFDRPFGFGFIKVTVNVSASRMDSIEKTVKGFIFLKFIRLRRFL